VFPVDYVTPVIFMVVYAASFVLLLVSIRRGIRTSAAQFFLYLSSLLCGVVTFRSASVGVTRGPF
jgi:hypothetical protein